MEEAALLLCLYSSDSEDTSDSEDEYYLELAEHLVKLEYGRKISKLKQQHNFYCEEIVPGYARQEFINHFRIMPELFHQLTGRFERSSFYIPERRQGGGKPVISPEKHLYCYLWYLGHRAPSFRDMANRFGLSTQTVGTIMSKLNGFFKEIAKEVIVWPTGIRILQINDYFAQISGLPHVIGCLDGMHVSIAAPPNNRDGQCNRKKHRFIKLQGICDHQNKFIDVFTNFPGLVHDARVLKNCLLYDRFPDICKGGYLVGNGSYPLASWFMTPYRDNGHLTANETRFNQKLSSAQEAIKETFRLLKARFLILKFVPLKSVSSICDIIMSCCVIHNMAQPSDLENIPSDEVDISLDDSNITSVEVIDDAADGSGNDLRRHLTNVLAAQKIDSL